MGRTGVILEQLKFSAARERRAPHNMQMLYNCTPVAIVKSDPILRGFWEEKFRPRKPRIRGVRVTRGQLLFPVLTQTTDIYGNRSCDNAPLHYKTSQYAFIYYLKLFYQSKSVIYYFGYMHLSRTMLLETYIALHINLYIHSKLFNK